MREKPSRIASVASEEIEDRRERIRQGKNLAYQLFVNCKTLGDASRIYECYIKQSRAELSSIQEQHGSRGIRSDADKGLRLKLIALAIGMDMMDIILAEMFADQVKVSSEVN